MKKITIYGEEIVKEKLEDHKIFLKEFRKKVDEINKKFNYDPISEQFKSEKKPH